MRRYDPINNNAQSVFIETGWVPRVIAAVVLLFGCFVLGAIGYFLARIYLSGVLVVTAIVYQSQATGTVTITGLPALAGVFGDITVSVIAAAIVALVIALQRRAKVSAARPKPEVEQTPQAPAVTPKPPDRPVENDRPDRKTTGRSVIVSPGEAPRIVVYLPASDGSSRLEPVVVAQLGQFRKQDGATTTTQPGDTGLPADWFRQGDQAVAAERLGQVLQSHVDSADAQPFLQQLSKVLPNINELVLTGLRMHDSLTTAAKATIPVDVAVGFKTDSAIARVANGRLVELQAPQGALTIDVRAGGIPFPSIEIPYDIGARLPLGQGIPLTTPASS